MVEILLLGAVSGLLAACGQGSSPAPAAGGLDDLTLTGTAGARAACRVLTPEIAARALGAAVVRFPLSTVGSGRLCGYHLPGRRGTLAAYDDIPLGAPSLSDPVAAFSGNCSPPGYASSRHPTGSLRASLTAADEVTPGALRCHVTTAAGVLVYDAVTWSAHGATVDVYVRAGDDDDLPVDAGLRLAQLVAP